MKEHTQTLLVGLGDFWGALCKDKSAAGDVFRERMHDFEVVGPAEIVPQGAANSEVAVPMVLWNDLIDCLLWITATPERYEAVSFYPTVITGCGEVDATLISVSIWEHHLEGLVEVAVGGKQFTYFDAFFPVSRETYHAGQPLRVGLSALAVSVRRMSEIAEYVSGDGVVTSTLSHVYETGQSWCGHTRQPEHPKDFHMIFGQLTEVRVGLIGPLVLYRCRIDLFPGVSIPVVFGQSSVEEQGWTPETGSWVCLMVFLHGYRTGHQPSRFRNG